MTNTITDNAVHEWISAVSDKQQSEAHVIDIQVMFAR